MVTKHTSRRKAKSDGDKHASDLKPLWMEIVELGSHIPDDELERHPADFVEHYHHYMHGHPKRKKRSS